MKSALVVILSIVSSQITLAQDVSERQVPENIRADAEISGHYKVAYQFVTKDNHSPKIFSFVTKYFRDFCYLFATQNLNIFSVSKKRLLILSTFMKIIGNEGNLSR